jgi:hypothetical protein
MGREGHWDISPKLYDNILYDERREVNVLSKNRGQETGGLEKQGVHQTPQAGSPQLRSLAVFLGISRLVEETRPDPTPQCSRDIKHLDVYSCHTSVTQKVFGRCIPVKSVLARHRITDETTRKTVHLG